MRTSRIDHCEPRYTGTKFTNRASANARTPMQSSRALGANQCPTEQYQYGPERSRSEFRHNDQPKKKSYADQLRQSDRCTFCGEGNHREWSCKFGQPITCFSCNNDGHKAKYCEFFSHMGGGAKKVRLSPQNVCQSSLEKFQIYQTRSLSM